MKYRLFLLLAIISVGFIAHQDVFPGLFAAESEMHDHKHVDEESGHYEGDGHDHSGHDDHDHDTHDHTESTPAPTLVPALTPSSPSYEPPMPAYGTGEHDHGGDSHDHSDEVYNSLDWYEVSTASPSPDSVPRHLETNSPSSPSAISRDCANFAQFIKSRIVLLVSDQNARRESWVAYRSYLSLWTENRAREGSDVKTLAKRITDADSAFEQIDRTLQQRIATLLDLGQGVCGKRPNPSINDRVSITKREHDEALKNFTNILSEISQTTISWSTLF